MLNRVAPGVLVGLIFGVCGALGIVVECGASTVGATAAYVLAAATGVVMGAIAGKPCWARNAGLECALKALFGASVGTFCVFLLRCWGPLSVDLRALHAGSGALGALPAAFLPLVAVALACLYELDDTSESNGAAGAAGVRSIPNVRIARTALAADEAVSTVVAPAEIAIEDACVDERRPANTRKLG